MNTNKWSHTELCHEHAPSISRSALIAAFEVLPSICLIVSSGKLVYGNRRYHDLAATLAIAGDASGAFCRGELFEPAEGFFHTEGLTETWSAHLSGRTDETHTVLLRTSPFARAFTIAAERFDDRGETMFVVTMSPVDEAFRQQGKLLEEYREAVDRSAIVSKTDPNGLITYVNDKFCEVSGYRKEELIGRAHSLIRHPDMPSETFTQMWRTLLAKKPWFGIVKNRKKDGGIYYVDTVINPIIDSHGEVVEFIGIRYDITDLEMLKQNLYNEIEETQKELILRLGEIGETRSLETGNHVKRVAEYSGLLAQKAGLSEQDAALLHLASPMHDIGKIGIPDAILNKTGPLDNAERAVMRSHCRSGYELLKTSERPILKTAAIVALQHHEKWDGSGYPRGLKGEAIHIFGRITAIADVFDALGSKRLYKEAWPDEKVFAYLKNERGRHFDPNLIDIFFNNLQHFLHIRDKLKDDEALHQEIA